MKKFEDFRLNHNILKAITELGFSEPTTIQERSIPVVLDGNDIFATALTGTGKTAAFALPILHKLKSHNPSAIRAIVVAPTKELAMQIDEEFGKYGKYMDLKTALIVGGKDLIAQKRLLKRGGDVVVATPTKLLEHIQTGLDVSKVAFFVVDEADRMLDMGFVKEIRKIHEHLPKRHQTLLFSATKSEKIHKLSKLLLKKPIFIETAKQNTTVANIKQIAYKVDEEQKTEACAYLIGSNNFTQSVVFTKTKKSADFLAKELETFGLKTTLLHGDIQRSTRLRRIKEFKEGKYQVLVATDLVSRGLDIVTLEAVINYELPAAAYDYVHRVGRVGRCGRDGVAISLLDVYERYEIREIEKIIQQKIPQEILEGFEPDPTKKREDRTKPKLKSEYQNQPKKRKTKKKQNKRK